MSFRKDLIIGNSDTLLPRLVEQGLQVDLILTDPPYNLNKDFGNKSDSLSMPEFLEVSRSRIEACRDLLAPDGSMLWFGIHHYIGFLQTLMYDSGMHYRRMYIWRYRNGFSRSKRAPKGEFEPFLWFSKSPKNWTFNADDVRVPYSSADRLRTPVWYKNSRGERKAWEPHPGGAMRGDVWEFPTLAGKRYAHERTDHPTQKPESLFVELIKAHCPKNSEGRYEGIVLDPFLGSGTTAVACERLNQQGHEIEWIGIEMEERWADVTKSRLSQLDKDSILF